MNDLKDIFAVVSILIKFDRCDILEDKKLFVEFINELGFRLKGERFTVGSFNLMIGRLHPKIKMELIEAFNAGHELINRKVAMYQYK